MVRIAVLTPALPSRLDMLRQASDSVRDQTLQPAAHLIGLDYERRGTAAVKNQLAQAAHTEWVAFLEDDDLFYPHHLETLAEHTDADIVYSWCDVIGRAWSPNRHFDADDLLQSNYIPSTALIRRDLIIDLGGWKESSDCEHGWEDWDFWKRALEAGAEFRCVPAITWQYRFWGGNKTYLGEVAAQ